jgi:glutathione S-transferase
MKALIALYENDTPFTFKMLDSPEGWAELASLWPMRYMPLLLDGDKRMAESSVIIEHLDLYHPGPVHMIPTDPKVALHVRFLDRIFDNYVMTPMNRIVFDFIRKPDERDPLSVVQAKDVLNRAYAWLDQTLPTAGWGSGADFSLVDCAAAPSLLYADWVHPIDPKYTNLRAYRARLLARPSVARVVDDARPYRAMFPPGPPNRD